MDPRIRKRALEAAAKVALSVTSLTGCGGKVFALEDGGAPAAWTMVEDPPAPSASKTPSAPSSGADFTANSSDPARDASWLVGADASVDAAIVDARVDHYEAGLCGSPPLGVNAIPSEATATCCQNHLRAAADAAAEPWLTLRAEPGTPECCHAILSYCEGPDVKSGCLFYDVVSIVCCPLLPPTQVSFCGPWGPPTPPAMPRSLDCWLA